MATLSTCIRRAGKALNRGDADAIREIYDDLRSSGVAADVAAPQAVDEYVSSLEAERADIVTQVRDQGGRAPGDRVLRLAADNTITKRLARKINIRNYLGRPENLKVEATGFRNKSTLLDIGRALEAEGDKIGVDLTEMTPETKDIIATVIADETEAAMKESGHAGHWYSDKLRNAMSLVMEIHPELKNNPDDQAMFLAALAITSNGMDVPTNARYAEEQYQAYKETGRFPLFGKGIPAQQMKNAFAALNELLEKKGPSATRQFLATEFTKRELHDLGFDKVLGSEAMDLQTHGSGIFGPKIGVGFYQNLIGNFNPLTTDRWFMRTWGRITGRMIDDPYSPANTTRRADFRKQLATKKGQEKLTELGYNKEDAANDDTLVEIAKKIHAEYSRGNYKDRSALNKTAKNLNEGVNGLIDAPTSTTQRQWIREVVTEARSKLAQRGLDVDTATMQALIWYPEKNLYTQYGVGNAKAAPTDYEAEFAKLAASRGVDPATIRGIVRRETGRRAGDGGRDRESDEFEAIRRPIEEKARDRYISAEGVRAVRRTGRATYKERARRSGKALVIDGANVVQTWQPQAFAKNTWERTGNAAPDIHQLDIDFNAPAAVGAFVRGITAAKKAHPQGESVYIYPEQEYEAMQLYMTEDGMAGFALKDDDIISVFKHPDLDAPNVVQSMVSLAVQQGGRRLDAFDTVLPTLYAQQGFRVISRLKWDESQAPPGWNKETFSRYNNGEPDVVFMAYDPENFNDYTGEGEQVTDYDTAVEMQLDAVATLMYPDLGDVRLRIEDDIAEGFADENPKHPHSQLFRMAMSVEDQSGNSPGMAAHVRNLVRNQGDKAREINLGIVHRNYLEDFQPKGRMPSISDYNHLIRELDGRKNVLTERYDGTARKMFMHKVKNRQDHFRLGEAMFHSTLNQMDPTKPYKSLKKRENMTEADKKLDTLRRAEYKILKNYFDTQLSPEARELYAEVRDQYSHLRNQMKAAIDKRIDDSAMSGASKKAMWAETQKMFEQGRMEPYFPLDRWGDRYGVARDENGDVFSFSKFENVSDQEAWGKSMREAGFDVQLGQKIKGGFYGQADAIDPKLVQKIVKLTQGVEGGDQIADEMYQLYLRSLPEVSMRKHFIHRKGRPGYSNNILRSFASHMFHGATQVARMEIRPQLEDAMRRINEEALASEAVGDKHSQWAVPILNEMQTRHELAMNPPQSVWASWATGLGFGWLLGITPGAALLNLFQTPMFAMPTVAARKGNGPTKTTIAFAKATKEFFSTTFGLRYRDKLRGDELDAYDYATNTGIFQKTMSHDLADIIEQSDDAYGIRRNMMTVVSFLFHHTEQANRQITFMAAYRLARERGLSHQDALYDAADLNDRSHYDYGQSNRPPILQQDVVRVIFLFKNYGLHSTYQIARAFNDGILRRGGQSPEAKNEQLRKFTGIMMMTGMLGGISALPMSWVVEKALNAALGDEDEPYDAGNEFKSYLVQDMGLSPQQVDAIVNGGWNALTETDMASRISLSYLGLWREPYKQMEGTDFYHYMLEEIAGPVPSIIGSFTIMGPADIAAGNIDRGIEKMLPKFGRDLLKTWRYLNEGALTYKDEPIMTAEEFRNRDLFAQAMGLTPNPLALRYEQNKELRNMDDALKKRRRYIMDRFFMAIRNDDKEGLAEARAMAMRWNSAHPYWAIGNEELERSARARATQALNTFGGVNLNPRLNYQLRREMTWLPVETGEPLPRPPQP